MTIQTPTWVQGGTYPARLDRAFIEQTWGGVERVFDGLEVSQRAAGANASVDVSVGSCVIKGDDQANQGMYLVNITAPENVAMPAAPVSNQRFDIVSLKVNDPTAGGPAGDNAALVVTQGVAGPSPVIPAVPPTAVPLAVVTRTAGELIVSAADIADVRPLGAWPFTVSASAPTGDDRGIAGDLWLRCE